MSNRSGGFYISTFLRQEVLHFADPNHGALRVDCLAVDLKQHLITKPRIATSRTLVRQRAAIFIKKTKKKMKIQPRKLRNDFDGNMITVALESGIHFAIAPLGDPFDHYLSRL
jgi:hypothetical protein